jgi:hypothetical protein
MKNDSEVHEEGARYADCCCTSQRKNEIRKQQTATTDDRQTRPQKIAQERSKFTARGCRRAQRSHWPSQFLHGESEASACAEAAKRP